MARRARRAISPVTPSSPLSFMPFAHISVNILRYTSEPQNLRAAEREMEWEERPEGREGLAGQEARPSSTHLRTLRHLVGPSVPEVSMPCVYMCM